MISRYVIPSNLTWIITLGLIIFAFFSRKRSPLITRFYFYTASLCMWSFGYSRMAWATDPAAALFWSRELHIGAGFIPTTFVDFALALLPGEATKASKYFIRLGYLLSVVFVVLCFTSRFIFGVMKIPDGIYYPKIGPSYI